MFDGGIGFEEDDFGVGLPAELESDGSLGEVAVAYDLSGLVEDSSAVGAADADGAFSDGGEDGIAGGFFEEDIEGGVVLFCVGDGLVGVGMEGGPCGIGGWGGAAAGEESERERDDDESDSSSSHGRIQKGMIW